MDNKTKRLWVRLSPEDERLFKEKASKYHSVSAMVRDAVRQFNDIATVGKIDALLSNKEMKSKIEIMDKYAGLGIAREVIETCKNKEWNECSIRNRTNELNKLFIELWPFE